MYIPLYDTSSQAHFSYTDFKTDMEIFCKTVNSNNPGF